MPTAPGPPPGAGGSNLLNGIEVARFDDGAVSLVPVVRDFDGNGNSDILFRDAADGGAAIWRMEGLDTRGMTLWNPVPLDRRRPAISTAT